MNFTLEELDLLDAPAEAGYDNLTQLASRILGAPVSLVSILDFTGDRQFFKSHIGLPEPWATERQTPLTHSFCQHVVRNNESLVVNYAPEHPLVKDNLAIRDLDVIAYLGVPVYVPDGAPVGAFCAIDGKPRAWSKQDIETLQQLASCVCDIIELKAAIRVSERLRREQQDFTYAISHDLRTPANTVRMILDEVSVEKDKLSADSRELLGEGFETLDRMAEQIEDVLSYSRMVHRDNPQERVSLSEIAEDAAADLGALLRETGGRIDIGGLPEVTGDKAQLRSLFLNLLGNALKFKRPEEPPLVRVRMEPSEDSQVQFYVEDNGIGIESQHQKSVFELFQRLHLRTEYPGSGIGLTLCRRVVENHGGNISIVSDGKTGTIFTITLPKDRP